MEFPPSSRWSANLSHCSALILGVLLAVPALAQKSKPKPPDQPTKFDVVIDKSTNYTWRPVDNFFKSDGPIRIRLKDLASGETAVLVADDAEGSPDGDIIVKGRLTLERKEGLLQGRSLLYRAQDKTGQVMDAKATVGRIKLTGSRIELLPGDSLKAIGASLTTCSLEKPDYRFTAKEILIQSDGTVFARGLTFWVKGSRILSFPNLRKNFTNNVNSPFPFPVYNSQNLVNFTKTSSIIEDPGTSLGYNLLLTFRRTPQGFLTYEHEVGKVLPNSPPPDTRNQALQEPLRSPLQSSTGISRGFPSLPEDKSPTQRIYAVLSSNTFVYNRKNTQIQVSRLPEIGFAAGNILSRKYRAEGGEGAKLAESRDLGALFSPHRWVINGEVGLGLYREHPTRVETKRAAVRLEAVSPSVGLLDRLDLRLAAAALPSAYATGQTYAILAPEAELTWRYKPNTLFQATYRYQKAFGATPFLFDRLDVAKELRLRYAFGGANWAYDLGVNYDMGRRRAYDTLASIRRRFDCFEVGIGWQQRNQGIGFILNLFPGFAANR